MPVLATGRYLRLKKEDGWEWCERVNSTGVVVIVALTPADKLLLVEQHRAPVGGRVVELPAGLAGDLADARDEDFSLAAARELEEETGYRAEQIERLTAGPVSAGMTSEVLTWYRASGLTKVSAGGGDDSEDIVVHEVPLDGVEAFLDARQEAGSQIDPKVFAGLFFAHQGRKPTDRQT